MANAPTPKEVRERIAAIAAESGLVQTVIVGQPAEYKLTQDELPALVVTIRASVEREFNSQHKRLVTREYQALLLVELMSKDDQATEFAALENVWQLLDSLPDYFAEHAPRLELNHAPLAGVHSTGHMSDGGAIFTPWNGDTFAAAVYTLPVITNRAA